MKRYNVKAERIWRTGATVLALVCSSSIFCFAADSDKEIPPPDYFVGRYEVVGRKPDSKITYSGMIELRQKNGEDFVLIRRIDGHEIKGTATLDHADPPADHPAVLRIHFSENGREYEGIFLWRSDLDNFPRLTGLISEGGKLKSKSVGLEAWFPTLQKR